GVVALPILQSIYGHPALLPAAIATVFVATVMFPATVVLLETEGRGTRKPAPSTAPLIKHIVLNPLVLSTLVGLVWASSGLAIPAPIAACIFWPASTRLRNPSSRPLSPSRRYYLWG